MFAQEGHTVTLLTRGKKPVTFQIPDDTDASYKDFQSAVQHIACDRTDTSAIQDKLGGKNFDGEHRGVDLPDDPTAGLNHSLEWCAAYWTCMAATHSSLGIQTGAESRLCSCVRSERPRSVRC